MALDLQNPKAVFPPRPGLSDDFLLNISSDPEQLDQARDLISAGPRSTVIYAAEEGAPGGTADDTNALLSVINAAPVGSKILLPAHTEYRIQPDALAWNTDGLTLEAVGGNGTTFTTAAPIIRLLGGGGFGIKVGAKENYSSGGLKSGLGIRGIKINLAQFGFSQGGLMIEGVTKAVLERFMLANAGKPGPGAVSSVAMRLRAVWDTTIFEYFLHSLYNPGAPLVWFDDTYVDANGNCNNLRWLCGHHEHFDGQLFYSGSGSNLDVFEALSGKFESTVGTDPANNWVFNLSGATDARISGNRFGLIKSTTSRGIARFGTGCWKPRLTDNAYYNCSGIEVLADTGSRGAISRGNTHNNPDGPLSTINLSAAPADLTPVGDAKASTRAIGFTPASRLITSTESFIPDGTSVSADRTVFRQTTTTQGTNILGIYAENLTDIPLASLLAVRVRRTAAGATASLQASIGGTTVQARALDDLPAALTGVSLAGNGSVVTATKAAHGRATGDRIIIAGANESGFNTPNGAPAAITVVNANVFTYEGTGVGSATGTITARPCPWQIAYLPLSYGTELKDLSKSGANIYVQYGASNNQVLDVDGAMVVPAYGGIVSRSASGDGATVVIGNGVRQFIHQPGAALGSLTLQLPSVPEFDQTLQIAFLSSITTLTLNSAAGHTVIGAPARVRAGTSLTFVWRSVDSSWYLFDRSCPSSPQLVAYAATISPSINAGNLITVGPLTGAITINGPGSVPPAGDSVVLFLTQDGTGGRAVTMGAKWLGTFVAGSPTANQRRVLTYISDGTDLWIQGDSGWVT